MELGYEFGDDEQPHSSSSGSDQRNSSEIVNEIPFVFQVCFQVMAFPHFRSLIWRFPL